MRQGEPNPLQRELARVPQAGPHPDADLLTALAEGSLLEREREKVFAHLAGCADCREVLNGAMGAAEIPVGELKPFLMARPTIAPGRRWVPWASIAAAIVLVSTVGLVYRQRMEWKGPAKAENTEEASSTNQPLPPVSAEPGPGTRASAVEPAAKKLKSADYSQGATPMASAVETPAEELKQSDASDQSAQLETAGAQETRKESIPAARDSHEASAPAPAAARQESVPTTQAEVQAEAQPQSAPAFLALGPAFEMNNASRRALNKSSLAAMVARPKWRIDSTGAAERAIGAGAWQKVLPDESAKMRVVLVLNADVWVGGENTHLYLSVDNGNTWNAITLPAKGGSDHAIVHISFKTQQTGTVEADDGTSWSTTDGGASWK